MPKVYVKTYGCQMNERDSEQVARMFSEGGYTVTPDENEADAILINTCSVRDQAEQKALGKMGTMMHRGRDRKCGNGCDRWHSGWHCRHQRRRSGWRDGGGYWGHDRNSGGRNGRSQCRRHRRGHERRHPCRRHRKHNGNHCRHRRRHGWNHCRRRDGGRGRLGSHDGHGPCRDGAARGLHQGRGSCLLRAAQCRAGPLPAEERRRASAMHA